MAPSGQAPGLWSAAELGAFFVQNRPEFLSHARRVAQSSAEAEEIVQDALVRVLLACPELESPEHAKSYFHRVIENLGIDIHRREQRQPRLLVLDDAASELEASWHQSADHADVVAAADDAAIVREAISLLSPAERAALIMWEFEGRSTSDIARELGVTEKTVRHTVARARAGLRRILAERIIDEERSLTALDLLSVTFRKLERGAQKSSRVALSLLLVLSAFVSFNSLTTGDFLSAETPAVTDQVIDGDSFIENTSPSESKENESDSQLSTSEEDSPQTLEKSGSQAFSQVPPDLIFLGLDVEGIPTGFTVADSRGSMGSLFAGQQKSIVTESGLILSNIVSTRSSATNVLMNQSIVLDAFGTSYVAGVSVGINGGWRPLRLSFVSTDVERLASGNYLLAAIMMVDSAIETAVKVPTSTSGTDLSSAPQAIATRVLLDPTKTKILAQAVLVSADSQGDGA
jgi:RNA polymerase sigma factor (sigma-70 family)